MAIEVVYWLAVLCGIVGALTGSRAAWALLSSVALSYALQATGASFEVGLWIAIDLCVAAWVLALRKGWSDWFIAGLFLPIWALYFAPDWMAYYGVSLLMSAQFLFTLPWKRILARAQRSAPDRMEMDDFFNLKFRGLPWGRKILG